MDKFEVNRRVQARYDELMRQGRHGHYETMFRIVHEERDRAIIESAYDIEESLTGVRPQ